MNSEHHLQQSSGLRSVSIAYYSTREREMSFNRCESKICLLTRDEARRRLERPSSVRSSPSSSSYASVKDLMNENEMENKIIALDYRLKLDECLRK